MKTKALVVLSGGQDSTSCLFWARSRFEEVHAITFDYKQRHQIEIEAAKIVAALANVVSHEIVNLDNSLISTSPLLSDNKLEQYASFDEMDKIIGERIELTFVPMRNALFLTIAANRAVALGCTTLVTGICQEDNANYPDCTEGFREAFERMVRAAMNMPQFQVRAPYMFMTKAEMVADAFKMPGCWKALAYSHTSYDGKYPPTDLNHSNVLRAHGFEKAGLPDPLVLRAVREGAMTLPTTPNYNAPELFDPELF